MGISTIHSARQMVLDVVGTDRQCEHIKRDGQRCAKMSRKGKKLCSKHDGSALPKYRERQLSKGGNGEQVMPVNFYDRRLGPKLRRFIDEHMEAPYAEQRQVYGELAMIRQTAGDCAALYNSAIEAQDLPDDKCSPDRKRELLLEAGSMMRFAMIEVVKVAKVAAEIDANGRDKFSAATLHDVTNQILVMVRKCFDQYPDAMMDFDQLMSEELRLPALGINGEIIGTELTPDQDVTCMDLSITPIR